MIHATLFNIQRFSTEDGPGIRSTVFFKGCPLVCPWCHNPEGMRSKPEIVWYEIDCVSCGECTKACPEGALKLTHNGLEIDRFRCKSCGTCVKTCDVGAIEMIGKNWTPDDLLVEVLKDKTFYQTSNGGITLSGGEPLIQYDFLKEFLPLAKNARLHVALDTCGFYPSEKLADILEFIDLVLFDIKILDGSRHKEYTGVDVDRILENAIMITKRGIPIWIRTPVIPRYTESDDNIRAIAQFIRKNLPTVERYDLLAFSNLCISKYKRLGRKFALEGEKLLSRERMEELVEVAKREGVSCARWSGPTRLGE